MDQEDIEKSTVSEVAADATTEPTSVNPGHGLGIASLVLSLIGIGLVGLIIGIIGLNRSKKAGQKNGLAIAGIVIGVVNIVVMSIIVTVLAMGAATLVNKCNELGSGTHIVSGVTYTCGASGSSNTY